MASRISYRVPGVGLLLVAAGWIPLWTVDSFWNPLAFTALWTGVALVAWGLSAKGYPGITRHLGLAAVSVPIWWWFELVNTRVANWHYVFTPHYSDIEYAVLSTLAFSTVVPALVALTAVTRSVAGRSATVVVVTSDRKRLPIVEISLGVLMQAAVFIWPGGVFPLVWVAPFLIIDGCVGLLMRRSLVGRTLDGAFGEVVLIGTAGLSCGILWEFWNYWSMPKWEYTLPYLGFASVFEMPVLGYGGYVPFALFVIQAVTLADVLWLRAVRRSSAPIAIWGRSLGGIRGRP
ncbi:MAG: hypothetical protein IIA53_04755 [Chloroflexi bacterium]|nr:hypothetical protein [Chloroflexota bacterium]